MKRSLRMSVVSFVLILFGLGAMLYGVFHGHQLALQAGEWTMTMGLLALIVAAIFGLIESVKGEG